MKKTLKIILAIIILLVIGAGAYWVFDRGQGGDGSPFGEGNLSIGDLFPFGSSDTTNPNTSGTNTTDTGATNQNPVPPPRFWQISLAPQSGATTFLASTTESARTPTVRFVDKATGNIYEGSLTLLGLRRITNTTIPRVYESAWQNNGRAVVMQYLDDTNQTVRNVYGQLNNTNTSSTEGPEGGLQEFVPSNLPSNITSISVNELGGVANGALAFVTRNVNGSEITITNTTGLNPQKVFESAIKDWQVSWVDNSTLGLLTSPSADALGQFYLLKISANGTGGVGTLSRSLGNKYGLTALSNTGATKIFYSESRNSSIRSALFDPRTGTETSVSLITLPDKCVWSATTTYLYCAVPTSLPSAKYPDHWYQGKISFTDQIWRIDTVSGASEFLINPSLTHEEGIDAVNLVLDPTETYLVFTNKKDGALWGLRIAADN